MTNPNDALPHDQDGPDDPHEEGHEHPHPHGTASDHRQAGHGHGDDGHGDDEHGDHDDHDDDHGHERAGGIRGLLSNVFGHSHDAADSFDSALESSQKGIRAVKISLVALMVTAAAQALIVIVTGSVALLADTIHNFSDALTSVPLWIAFVLGRRAASRSYTYGYRRAEDLAGLFIVGMIAFSAILAGWESIDRLWDPRPIFNLPLLFAAGIVGFLGNEAVALYRIRVGRDIGSAALIADGYHARTDGFTSLAVVVGAVGVALGYPQADAVVGLLITVAIVWVLRDAIRQVFGRLMDRVEPGLVTQIERVASGVEQVEAVDAVRARWIGHRLEASLHVTVNCQMTVADGHEIGERVRHALFHDLSKLDEVVLHIDPCDHEDRDHHLTTLGHVPTRTPAAGPEQVPSR